MYRSTHNFIKYRKDSLNNFLFLFYSLKNLSNLKKTVKLTYKKKFLNFYSYSLKNRKFYLKTKFSYFWSFNLFYLLIHFFIGLTKSEIFIFKQFVKGYFNVFYNFDKNSSSFFFFFNNVVCFNRFLDFLSVFNKNISNYSKLIEVAPRFFKYFTNKSRFVLKVLNHFICIDNLNFYLKASILDQCFYFYHFLIYFFLLVLNFFFINFFFTIIFSFSLIFKICLK